VELAVQVDGADFVLARKLREHRFNDLLDVALLMTEVVVERLQRRVDDLQLSRALTARAGRTGDGARSVERPA
jgi:hypothetical protein